MAGSELRMSRVRISVRVRESTLAKTPANESTRVQLDSRKLSDVSHKLNTGESKNSCKLHLGESKWTLAALYKILPLMIVVTDPGVTPDTHVIENHATIENMKSRVKWVVTT